MCLFTAHKHFKNLDVTVNTSLKLNKNKIVQKGIYDYGNVFDHAGVAFTRVRRNGGSNRGTKRLGGRTAHVETQKQVDNDVLGG